MNRRAVHHRTQFRVGHATRLGFTFLALSGCGGDKPTAPKDVVGPAAISDLAVTSTTPTSATLSWTAPGDDGSQGVAAEYDLRFSTGDSSAWDSMVRVPGVPHPKTSGQAEEFVVQGLEPETKHYFAIRAADEVPNWSALSPRASSTTSCIGDDHWTTMGQPAITVLSSIEWNGDLLVGGASSTDPMVLKRWTGSSWDDFATIDDYQTARAVTCMSVYDGRLIVSGRFGGVDGIPANHVASFDGISWQPLSSGLSWELGGDNLPIVSALLVFQGDLIVAGDNISHAGGTAVSQVARWDGGTWHAMGASSFPGTPLALVEYNGDLIVGVNAGGADDETVLRWNGSTWDPLGQRGVGGGQGLVVQGGSLIAVGGVSVGQSGETAVARWGGASWSYFGETTWVSASHPVIHNGDLIVSVGLGQDVNTNSLYAIMRWNGAGWSRLGCILRNSPPSFMGLYEQSVLMARYGGGSIGRWTD